MRENTQRLQRYIWYGSSLYGHLRDTIWLPFFNTKKLPSRSALLISFFLLFFLGAFTTTRLLDTATLPLIAGSGTTPPKTIATTRTTHVYPDKMPKKPRTKIEVPLNCSSGDLTRKCPANYYPTKFHLEDDHNGQSSATCPDYFRWIHEDLRPWRETGITRDMVERAQKTANFRLVIVDGRAHVQSYRRAFQSRGVFTQWGILQLLRRYPGKIPDLDLMFDCVDWPVVKSSDYSGPNATAPPPLFRYCRDDATLDIVFPDWSFWGWPEINIKPWEGLLEELKQGNKRKTWMEREAYAYWKGNPRVAATRMNLLKCNISDKHDWGARVFAQDWIRESQEGYKQSDLASQCIHRYKIYIEGSAWSVSEKYILACDSVTLVVKPRYFDFFTRSLMPVHHYWPVRDDDKCRSIKFAVDWGNSHKQKAQAIGKAASDFIQEDLKMDYVYDYMFHLLNEYSKLMRYKPTVPRKAIELCSETIACPSKGLHKKFMTESMVKGPIDTRPCSMPPPYDPLTLHSLLRRKANSIRQVELWEKKYWENQTTHN
ncbi:Protein O-glucosyltransferase [Actinidia chinensis var. chinensis]|uniref:Protein O-glucosyltransferase n=1 Tax=Actinidia chinensis var. chinensis TaxID=1590841 RepID=A0A2R6RSV1_ACTCC|nr:Protein O-glucosyltransferase [Actinidia chinensis var. chinensis]